jgi:hypothetical protein
MCYRKYNGYDKVGGVMSENGQNDSRQVGSLAKWCGTLEHKFVPELRFC